MIKWFSSFTPKNLCRTLLPVFVAFLIGSTLAPCLLHRAVQLGAGHLGVLPQVDSVVLGVVDGGALVVEVHLKVVHSLLRVGSEVLHTKEIKSTTQRRKPISTLARCIELLTAGRPNTD